MNSSEIRKRNIQHLIDVRYDGAITGFAKAVGKPDSQIHRIFNLSDNGRNVGDKLARLIEESLLLKKDSLDQPLWVVKETTEVKHSFEPPIQIREIADRCKNLNDANLNSLAIYVEFLLSSQLPNKTTSDTASGTPI
jgi:hypothetical protein